MLAEAFPRLAVRLRSTFPDAEIALVEGASKLSVCFPAFPAWEVSIVARPYHEQFQIVESSVTLRYDSLQNVGHDDFNRFIAAENLGLRGASIITDDSSGMRILKIRSTFIGQKGRTRDEAENLAIDTLSLLRFVRMLDDRILRSTAGDKFSYEMYYSQYLSKSIGRNRFINYARSIFQGSTTRVFGQVASMLKEDYKFRVMIGRGSVATIQAPNSPIEIILRVPDEIPMLTCSASLLRTPWAPEKSFALVAKLNAEMTMGHFEVNPDGRLISFVVWKHLTNDLRYYSLDQLIASIHEAEQILHAAMPEFSSSPIEIDPELNKLLASSLDAYRSVA